MNYVDDTTFPECLVDSVVMFEMHFTIIDTALDFPRDFVLLRIGRAKLHIYDPDTNSVYIF